MEAGPCLQAVAQGVLRLLGWRPGKPLQLILDVTKIEKRGEGMDAAHRFYSTTSGRAGFGHEIVLLCVRFQGVTLPWSLRIFLPRAHCEGWQQEYLTTNQLAAQMLDALPASMVAPRKTLALFDSAFLNHHMLKVCRRRALRFVSVAQTSRVFRPAHKKGRPSSGHKPNKRHIGAYGAGVLRYQGSLIELPSYRGTTRYRVAERIGALQKVGWVKVVFSRRLTDNGVIALVTNDTTMSAADVITAYRQRWTIEVLFKQLKQHLGLGDYRFSRLQGVERHLHLSAIAYLLLKHLGLRRPGEDTRNRTDAALGSVERLREKLCAEIAHDHIQRALDRHGHVPAITSLLQSMTGLETPVS